jgi:two-component system cell cycle sensor histidine kinase/response regulator CckA
LTTILLVDDEDNILRLLRARLEHHGYSVLAASDGVEALQVIHETNRIDLVITDIRMPKMDGFTLGEQLRSEYPTIPVIYMSGYSTKNVVKQAQDLRNIKVPEDCAYLALPFTEEQVLHAVRTVLAAA